MEELRNLKQIYSLAAGRFNQYEGKDFVLPMIFKEQVKEINSNIITYNDYSAVIETRGNQNGVLNIFLPNQWFYIASYFTDFYNELQRYKKEALKVTSKERLKILNGATLSVTEENRLQHLSLSEQSKNYLRLFMTDYSWWFGAKTIDRGDFYVSPILNSARLVNASQSFVAELCAFLADKSDLVQAIISGEESASEKHTPPNITLPLQQIFYGAPGTGKSHKIKDDADVKVADEKNLVFRTTFHPDSDYSTFVGCYKPTTSKSGIRGKQPILDYDSLVDKFKEYLNIPNVNITKACTLFGFDYHDSIIRIQENGRKVMDLVNDAYKSNTSYDSVVRGGMACYEQNPIQRNDSKITYEFIPQAFTNAYVKAWNKEENVYLIIEEINRGNCAQIFGDLFQLLDRKNGVSEYPVEADTDLQNYLQKALADTTRTDIPEEVKSGKKLMLPSNLYIWATMNTSDQSLFPIDSAFKRRWEWKYIKIKEGKDENGNKLDWKVDVKMDEEGTLLPWWDFIKKINEIIASMTSSADKQLGYFFCCAKNGVIDEATFVSKVIFYLWNDVFKDYGFEDASLFRYTTKDEEGKDVEKDLTFPDFYDEDGEKVNTERLTDFVKKVMSWKVDNKKGED